MLQQSEIKIFVIAGTAKPWPEAHTRSQKHGARSSESSGRVRRPAALRYPPIHIAELAKSAPWRMSAPSSPGPIGALAQPLLTSLACAGTDLAGDAKCQVRRGPNARSRRLSPGSFASLPGCTHVVRRMPLGRASSLPRAIVAPSTACRADRSGAGRDDMLESFCRIRCAQKDAATCMSHHAASPHRHPPRLFVAAWRCIPPAAPSSMR